MRQNKNLKRSLKKYSRQKENRVEELFGELGIPLSGTKVVDVPTRPGYVYVRLKGNTSELIQAYNSTVPSIYDLPVRVRRNRNTYVIMGKDQVKWSNTGNGDNVFVSSLPRHGGQHSLNPEFGMGADVSWIYSRQFMNQLAFPSGTSSMMLTLEPWFYEKDGAWGYSQNTGTPSFAPYVPTVTGSARMALLYLNRTTNALEIVAGGLFSGGINDRAVLAGFIPDVDRDYAMPLAAVKLTTGTSSLDWYDIYDMRDFYTVAKRWAGIGIQDEGIPAGTGSILNFVGAGVSATVSGSVIRVDVSAGGSTNPPVTGSIVLQNSGVTLGSVTKINIVGNLLDASILGDVGIISGTLNDAIFEATPIGFVAGNELIPVYDGGVNPARITPAGISAYVKSDALADIDFQAAIRQFAANGWAIDENQWTFVSADAPSYVATVDANVTGTVGLGMKVRVRHLNTTKYFIVTKQSGVTGSTTWLNLYGGTDYTLTTGSISDTYYSSADTPWGFPNTIDKWSVVVTDTSDRSQASPVTNTWYNPGSLSISVPIGSWNLNYKVLQRVARAASTATNMYSTLSTANNSETDSDLTVLETIGGASGSLLLVTTQVCLPKTVHLAAKTSYFLNCRTTQGADSIGHRGDAGTTVIKAVCAFL